MGHKHLGRIGHFAQTAAPHFVDAEFGCAAKAVFAGTQNAVHILPVALELKNGVDDVFEHFRTGK